MRRIRTLRILCFATAYFSIHFIYLVFFMVRTYSGTPEATWYFQHPLEAFQTVIFELSHNPRLLFLVGISFSSMIVCALLLGFVTDLVFTFLKKRILHRKRSAE